MINLTDVYEFVNKYSTAQDTLLEALEKETFQKTVYPQMLCSHSQGKLLEMISLMLKPANILEIGTFTGYSAICLAKGLIDGGKIVTIDRNEELSFISKKYFQLSEYEHKIIPICGEALEIIPELENNLDLVYIDGDKKQYSKFYNAVLPKLDSGSIILADNVFWYDKLLKKTQKKDADTFALEEFLQTVNEDERTENTVIPISDGVMMIRVK